jgi:hypothetical protein
LAQLDGEYGLDLVIANWGQNRFYHNNGGGHFTDLSARLPAELDETLSLAVGDVDGDGDSDLIVANLGYNRLLLNTRKGTDYDGDGLGLCAEMSLGTDPYDDDTDDDGLIDGQGSGEDINANGIVDEGETDPNNPDTDGDGVQDGTEKGCTEPEGNDTLMSLFVPDADPSDQTDPLRYDTDDDGLPDGEEDLDANGAVDEGETSPILADTDGDGASDGKEVAEGTDPLDPTCRPPIALASVRIMPKTLSYRRWGLPMRCLIKLPDDEDYGTRDIDQNSLTLSIPSCPGCEVIRAVWGFALRKRSFAAFPRRELIDQLRSMSPELPTGLLLLVSGFMLDGIPFEGEAEVRVIGTPRNKRAAP